MSTPTRNESAPLGDGFKPLEDTTTPPQIPNQPAVETALINVRPYHHPAAGFGAIVSTMKHTIHEMGLLRGMLTLLKVNQASGFDCPGCAWPEPDHRSRAEFCENGAKAVAAEGTKRRVTPEFFREWSVPRLLEQSDYWLESQGRLTHPMLLPAGASNYEPVSWDDAFGLLARELRALASADEGIFYTSGRTSNEAAFLYQLFVRLFGTITCPTARTCVTNRAASGWARRSASERERSRSTTSSSPMPCLSSVKIPGTNHPRMLSALKSAAKRGCHIVSVNPLHERALERFAHPQHVTDLLMGGTAIAELFLPVRINGDVALLKGLMKAVLAEETRRPGCVLDGAFIAKHTSGFAEFARSIEAVSWDEIISQSGIDREMIERTARIYINAERVIICWAMGLTQHKNGVANIREVINLLLLRGNLGKPGAGACPVRGHSNVQGDRTMGVYERPAPEFLDRLGDAFGFQPPREHGFDVVAAIKAMHEGPCPRLLRDGWQLPFGNARYRLYRRRTPPLPADRPCFNQIEPISPCHRQASSHFALPGSHRTRSTGVGAAIHHG